MISIKSYIFAYKNPIFGTSDYQILFLIKTDWHKNQYTQIKQKKNEASTFLIVTGCQLKYIFVI